MVNRQDIPEPTAYRLSLYHCYLGELIRGEHAGGITSRELAEKLGLREETVRRDISFVGNVGRPGAGYDVEGLFRSIQQFLGISDEYPTIRVGSAEMLRALQTVFPAKTWGVKPVAYYSENPEDVGVEVEGIAIQHITAIPEIDPELEVTVALIACSPGWVQIVVDLCNKAGITGLLLLTPKLGLDQPEGVTVTQIRMPCDIKSLACRCSPSPSQLLQDEEDG